MAYNRKIKLYGMKQNALLGVFILCIIAISLTGYFYYRNSISKAAANPANGKDKKAPEKTLLIARAKSGMKQGELLDVSRVELVEIPAELAPRGAVTSFSKLDSIRLKREVAEKEFLNTLDFMTGNVSFEEGDRLIEHNFAEGAVPAEVAEGSAIDIKLFVKGEEDQVVISKITVISRTDSLLSFYMNEQEQEFIKEAATEGVLFAVQYADTSQMASDVTYVPTYSRVKR